MRNGGTPINKAAVGTPKNPTPVGGFSSHHPGGANFCFADGSVRFLKESLSASMLQNLMNRSGGELLYEAY